AMKRAAKTLEQFAEAQAEERLKKLVSLLRKAAKHPEQEDSIHDLRVAIRRFKQGLRVFRGLFNSGDVKKMKRQLRGVMHACGAVRNCDIAREVLRAAGAPTSSDVVRLLKRRRSRAERGLTKLLANGTSHRALRKWKHSLQAKAANNSTVKANA